MATINKPKPKPSLRKQQRAIMYNDKSWKNLRNYWIQKQPLCQMCLLKGVVKEGEHVHHMLSPFEEGLSELERSFRMLSTQNLMTLCKECHNEIHGNIKKDKKNDPETEISGS